MVQPCVSHRQDQTRAFAAVAELFAARLGLPVLTSRIWLLSLTTSPSSTATKWWFTHPPLLMPVLPDDVLTTMCNVSPATRGVEHLIQRFRPTKEMSNTRRQLLDDDGARGHEGLNTQDRSIFFIITSSFQTQDIDSGYDGKSVVCFIIFMEPSLRARYGRAPSVSVGAAYMFTLVHSRSEEYVSRLSPGISSSEVDHEELKAKR